MSTKAGGPAGGVSDSIPDRLEEVARRLEKAAGEIRELAETARTGRYNYTEYDCAYEAIHTVLYLVPNLNLHALQRDIARAAVRAVKTS